MVIISRRGNRDKNIVANEEKIDTQITQPSKAKIMADPLDAFTK
jgi:hypothetical protein